MGLDMYLYAEKHIDSYEYEHADSGKVSRRDNPQWDKANELIKGLPSGEYGGIVITKCVMYWRKANAVHGWIVRECAQGVDECQRIDLEREDLIKLRDVCVEALKDRDNAVKSAEPILKLDTKGKSDNEVIEAMLTEIIKQADKDRVTNTVTEANPIPPTAGFFFGGSDKDEYYYDYLANTAETINAILASDLNNEYNYFYRASW